MIVDVGKQILMKSGYDVVSAKSGKEAIQVYKENQDRIDMAILDMILPDMDGGDTYDRVKEINPKIKVLLASGYDIDYQARDIMERGTRARIGWWRAAPVPFVFETTMSSLTAFKFIKITLPLSTKDAFIIMG